MFISNTIFSDPLSTNWRYYFLLITKYWWMTIVFYFALIKSVFRFIHAHTKEKKKFIYHCKLNIIWIINLVINYSTKVVNLGNCYH